MTELLLYSRPGCHLCDDMARQLAALLPADRYRVHTLDIDSDRELTQAFGLRIPVLTLDGEVIAEGRLDEDAVRDALGIR